MRLSTTLFVAMVTMASANFRLSTFAAPVATPATVQSANSTQSDSKTPAEESPQLSHSPPSSPAAVANDSHPQPVAASAATLDADAAAVAADKIVSATDISVPEDAAVEASKQSQMLNDYMPTNDVDEQGYDDLFLANQNEPESYDSSSDDEAMLEELFSPRQIRQASDVDVSPRAMAEYLLLTGDFAGVQQAVDDLITTGLLTPSEADRYRDAVGLEYSSMVQQNYIPSRVQRDLYRLQDPYVADSRAGDVADYVEYDTNSMPGNVLLPVVPVDEDEGDLLQQRAYLPADPQTLAQIDSRFLEELIQQQQQQPAGEIDSDNVNGNLDDERIPLNNADYESSRAELTNAEDGAEDSLEAELKALAASEQQAEQRDDKAEEELKQIGKLLRNTNKQGEQTAEKQLH